MSTKDTDREAQFVQSIPQRREKVQLDQQYKSIGISAVSAAASFKANKAKKKPSDQMS